MSNQAGTTAKPSLADLNHPSFIVSYDNKTKIEEKTFRRTVINVGQGGWVAMHKASVTAPMRSKVMVVGALNFGV